MSWKIIYNSSKFYNFYYPCVIVYIHIRDISQTQVSYLSRALIHMILNMLNSCCPSYFFIQWTCFDYQKYPFKQKRLIFLFSIALINQKYVEQVSLALILQKLPLKQKRFSIHLLIYDIKCSLGNFIIFCIVYAGI